MVKWTKMVESGKATRFKKGHLTWCKGTKGLVKNAQKGKKLPKLWDINNGRTLCKPCHYKTDTYGGKLSHKLTKLYG